MIKVDIVNEVSKVADITKVKAEVAVDAVFDAMRLSMQRGERIELRGFGVFQVKPRKRGIGRNPRTGKEVRIPPGRTIRFKPARTCRISEADSAGGPCRTTSRIPLRFPAAETDSRRSALACAWPPRRFQHVVWKHVLLFLLTLATTTLVGATTHYAAFLSEFQFEGDHRSTGTS